MKKFAEICMKGVGLALLVLIATQAFASPAQSVPEIDPGSAIGAITMLVGGIMLYKDRK